MAKSYHLDDLANLEGLAEKITNNPVEREYWIKEAKFMDKRIKRNVKARKMLEMSSEKWHSALFCVKS